MKEIKVADITGKSLEALREVEKAKEELAILIAQFQSMRDAMWAVLRKEYSLEHRTTHYIRDNSIYKQVVD